MTIDLIVIKDAILLIASLITASGVICAFIKKYFDKMTNKITKPILEKNDEIMNRIDKMERDQLKRFLTEFLADIRNGIDKDSYQQATASDAYKRYKDLGGNSYIQKLWKLYMEQKEVK